MADNDLGLELRKIRISQGWTKKQTASLFGVDEATVAGWEDGSIMPPILILEKMKAKVDAQKKKEEFQKQEAKEKTTVENKEKIGIKCDLGQTIRGLRIKKGWTQKDLAEKLYVTPQAVSRWENDGIEPPLATLKKMSTLFGVSLDKLIGNEKQPTNQTIQAPVKPKQSTLPPATTFYGTCDECGKAFVNAKDIHNYMVTKRVRTHGPHHQMVTTNMKICSSCANKHEEKKKQDKIIEGRRIKEKAHNCRLRAFWLTPLCAAAIVGIVALLIHLCCNQFPSYKNNPSSFYTLPLIITGVLSIPLFGCLFLNNNIVIYIVGYVLTKFSFKVPGLIISFDLEKLAVLLYILAIITFLVGLAGFVVATVIGSIVGIFVLPYAINKSYKYPEEVIF